MIACGAAVLDFRDSFSRGRSFSSLRSRLGTRSDSARRATFCKKGQNFFCMKFLSPARGYEKKGANKLSKGLREEYRLFILQFVRTFFLPPRARRTRLLNKMLLSAYFILFVIGSLMLVVGIRTAPEGYEDKDGFHYSQKEKNRQQQRRQHRHYGPRLFHGALTR